MEKGNNMPIFKKNENPGNYRHISFTCSPTNTQKTKGQSEIVSVGLPKINYGCSAQPVAFYSEMVVSVGMVGAVHAIQLEYHNSFDINKNLLSRKQ